MRRFIDMKRAILGVVAALFLAATGQTALAQQTPAQSGLWGTEVTNLDGTKDYHFLKFHQGGRLTFTIVDNNKQVKSTHEGTFRIEESYNGYMLHLQLGSNTYSYKVKRIDSQVLITEYQGRDIVWVAL